MTRRKGGALLLSAMVSGAFVAACDVAPDGPTSLLGEVGVEVAPMRGFSWVVEDQVAAMPRPGGSRALEEDLAFLRAEGIDVLISLTETPVSPDALVPHKIKGEHIPIADFHAPTQEQMDQYVRLVQTSTSAGLRVGTHCAGGLGRTGTMLATLFVARGMSADDAIKEVRRQRPGSIETAAQEQAIRDFAVRHE